MKCDMEALRSHGDTFPRYGNNTHTRQPLADILSMCIGMRIPLVGASSLIKKIGRLGTLIFGFFSFCSISNLCMHSLKMMHRARKHFPL